MPRKPSVIRDAKDIYEAFKGISRYKRERMYSILLDGESVIGIEKVSKGSEGLVDAPPEEVIQDSPGKGVQVHHPRAQPPQRIPLPFGPGQESHPEPLQGGRNIGIERRGQRDNRAGRVLLVRGVGGVAGVEGAEIANLMNFFTNSNLLLTTRNTVLTYLPRARYGT